MKKRKLVRNVVEGMAVPVKRMVLGGDAVHEEPVWYPDEDGRWHPGFYVGDVGSGSRIVRGDEEGALSYVVRNAFVLVRRPELKGGDMPL